MTAYVAIAAAVLALLVLVNLGCAQIPGESRALDAARNVGVENPRVVKRQPAWGVLGGCHEDDITKFTVKGSNRTVQVCAPILGGYTVRS